MFNYRITQIHIREWIWSSKSLQYNAYFIFIKSDLVLMSYDCMYVWLLFSCFFVKLWVGLQKASKHLDVWFNQSFSYIYSSLELFIGRQKTPCLEEFDMVIRRCSTNSLFFCHSSLSERSLVAFQNYLIVTLHNVPVVK